jgi:2'-5' RNA ligase
MFDRIWSRFVAGPTTLGPTEGAREAWHLGRPRYAVWLVRAPDPVIRDRLAAAADLLAPHGVHALPEPHVTVFVAGFPSAAPTHGDDIAEAVLDAQAAALSDPLPSPRLRVGSVNAFASCPILEVEDPHGDLERLRSKLASFHPEVRFAPYVPHLTVGVFSDTRPVAPIAAALTRLRALPPLEFRPDAVELVTFDTTRPNPPLETRARLPFR